MAELKPPGPYCTSTTGDLAAGPAESLTNSLRECGPQVLLARSRSRPEAGQAALALASAHAKLDMAIRAKKRGKSASWLAAGCIVA